MQQSSEQRKSIGNTSFAITARVAMQLGRESISNSLVAITELVKNAYDADAENVQIIFLDLDTEHPILIIDDDGNGMNLQQLRNSWMVIGTDYKQSIPRSNQKKRVLTGEKGLGRLGIDRLCEISQLQTFTEENPSGIEIVIDWRRYENTSAKLDSIEHEIFPVSKELLDPISGEFFTKSKGTRLTLKELKDDWTYEVLKRLYNELALLVSPFAGANDFSISFYASNAKDLSKPVVSESLLQAAEWKVNTTLDFKNSTAVISFLMSSTNTEAKFPMNTTWSRAFPEEKSRLPECGPIRFDFYYIPRKDIPALSLKRSQVGKFLENNQGIRIYRDGFRVMPYGKPTGEGDWLSLSLRRTTNPAPITGQIGGWKIGYNQVVGAVYIGREQNDKLLDQTNREGIVERQAFYDLRRFALYCIEFFEKQLQRYEKAQGKKADDEFEKARTAAEETAKVSIEIVEQFKNTVDSAVEILGQTSQDSPGQEAVAVKLSEMYGAFNKMVTDQQDIREQLLHAADQREEERQEEFQRQKDTLSNLASLGIMAATFGHETEAASNLVATNSNELRHNTKKLMMVEPDVLESINQNLDDIEHAAKQINTFATFTLGNVSRDKRQRTKVFLNEVVKRVFKSFSNALQEEHNIKIILEIPSTIPPINAFSIDWESIFINFITNAIWAMEDTSNIDRKIRVRIHVSNDLLHLSFADSGHGIADGTIDSIFEPTFSTRRNPNGDITGTGMGLAIVKNFVDSYGGNISVESPCDLGGAEFHIEIPC